MKSAVMTALFCLGTAWGILGTQIPETSPWRGVFLLGAGVCLAGAASVFLLNRG